MASPGHNELIANTLEVFNEFHDLCKDQIWICVLSQTELDWWIMMESDTYDIVAPGSAVIWLVTNTATLYSERSENIMISV